MSKKSLLIILLLGLVFQGYSQEVYTLPMALETAFINSPALKQSELSLRQQELNLKAQQASLKSQFSLDVNPFTYSRQNRYDEFNSKWFDSKVMSSSASFGIVQPVKWTDGTVSLFNDFSWQDASNQSSGGSNTSFNHNISLRLEQPLFTYNRTKMQLRELEFSFENARLSHALQRLNIERNVTENFYNLYRTQRELSIAREELANQKLNYEVIKVKVDAELIAREELFQAEVNLASSESTVYSQEISFENAKDRFKLLLGLPLDEDIMVLPNIESSMIEVNQNDAIKYALDQRMELRQKEISLEQNLFSIIRAKSENEFKGNISARIGLNALGEKFNKIYDNPTDNEQIGISLTIPIFDWGAKKARVESAELSRLSTEIDFDEQKKSIVLDVRQIVRNLPILNSQIDINRKKIQNAEMAYEINLERYRNGDITGMDLQQYQKQLTDAKQAYTNAIIDYKIELLNLKIQTLWDFEAGISYLPVDLLKK